MARPCLICSNATKTTMAAEMIAAGRTDRAVAGALNAATPGTPPLSAMAVSRHRRNHVLDVTKQRIAVISKGSDARQNRVELAAAAAADAPTPQQFVEAFFGLKAQSEKLQRIEDRLERVAALAEGNGSANGVAQVAAQQLRGVEVGSKLAGVGGYAPQRAGSDGVAGAQFAVNIYLSGGRVERITTVAEPSPPSTIDAEAEPDEGNALADLLPDTGPAALDLARLAVAFGAKATR